MKTRAEKEAEYNRKEREDKARADEFARKSSNGHAWGIAALITVIIIGTIFYFTLDRAQKITAADEFYVAHGYYETGTPPEYRQIGR